MVNAKATPGSASSGGFATVGAMILDAMVWQV